MGTEQFRRLGGFLSLAIVSACMLAGCGGDSTAETAEAGGQFDSDAAWGLVERQVEFGQRPAGSPQLRRLANELRPLLPGGRFEAIPGEPGLRNVVGVLPGREPALVLGAHYDTLVKPIGFVGANNGAAGAAVVIAAARALQRIPAGSDPREIRFVLFDGEEPAAGVPEEVEDFYQEGLRGSRAYVAAHPGETEAMILLDYVGGKGLQLSREGSSTPWLWERLVDAADEVGAGRFFSRGAGPTILDDHTPFLRSRAAAVDLIDWNYPGHDLRDGLDLMSRQSLDGVGETVVQLLDEMRSE